MKRPSKALLFVSTILAIVIILLIFNDKVEMLELQLFILFLLIWIFYLVYKLELKDESEAENAKKLKLLEDCEKYMPTLSNILQELLKINNPTVKKQIVSILVKNINEENLDFLMHYINQAKLYDEVEKHCQDSIKRLDPNKDTFQAKKADLEAIIQTVRFKSSRLFDHLFGNPA